MKLEISSKLEKMGYRIFGELDDFPTGHQRIYVQKKLTLTREHWQ